MSGTSRNDSDSREGYPRRLVFEQLETRPNAQGSSTHPSVGRGAEDPCRHASPWSRPTDGSGLPSAAVATPSSRIWETLSAALLGRPALNAAEIAAKTGVSTEQARRFWQALGFPRVPAEDRVFTQKDAEMLRAAAAILERETLAPDVLLQMTRATGQALARIATMHVLSIADEIVALMRNQALSEKDRADVVATLGESLLQSHEPFLGYVWRRHVLAAILQRIATSNDRASEDETGTIGFADLVDFTAISRSLAEHELAQMVERFEQIAYEQIPDRGGRVVKMLGDEIMFANSDSHAAADTALALAEACEADPILPDVRVGLALGPMLAWEGDLYGNTVNLASRLVGIAHPGTVLIADDLAERLRLDPAFTLHEIRATKLKGIGKTTPWVLRRPQPKPVKHERKRKRRHE
jgi:adenylate cyclase